MVSSQSACPIGGPSLTVAGRAVTLFVWPATWGEGERVRQDNTEEGGVIVAGVLLGSVAVPLQQSRAALRCVETPSLIRAPATSRRARHLLTCPPLAAPLNVIPGFDEEYARRAQDARRFEDRRPKGHVFTEKADRSIYS